MRLLAKKAWYQAWTPGLLKHHQVHQSTLGLSYHRFSPPTGQDPRPHMAIDTAVFSDHLHWLRELGTFASVDEYLQGQTPPGLNWLLSFDDGYADNAEHLPGLLEAVEAPCIIYAVSDYISGRITQLPHDAASNFNAPACRPEQLRALAQHPLISIGSHTVTHRVLSTLNPTELSQELRDSKAALEDMLQQPVHHFAAPKGQPADLPPTLMACASEAGYKTVATNFGGSNHGPVHRSVQHLRRIPMTLAEAAWAAKGWALGMHDRHEARHNLTLSPWDHAEEDSSEAP